MSHGLFLEKQNLPKIVILLKSSLVKLSKISQGWCIKKNLQELEAVLFDPEIQKLPEEYKGLRVKDVVLAVLKPLKKGCLSPHEIDSAIKELVNLNLKLQTSIDG